MEIEKQEAPPKVQKKSVKHEFTAEECKCLGQELARAWGALGNIQREFDNVKASYKAKITEQEARIGTLSTSIDAGFEMRVKPCVVVYRPTDRRKEFIVLEDWEDFGTDAPPALTEDMTQDDFQQELLQAESKFEKQERIELFPPAVTDYGLMVVGFLGKFWYAAVRVQIGEKKLEERLDNEQPIAAKKRFDAITKAADRYNEWLMKTLGKDNAKGFAEPLAKALEPHKERVE